MSQLQVVPAEMRRAADAVPGADCVAHLGELGSSWDTAVEALADTASSFAEDLGTHTDDVTGTDAGVGGWFGGLVGGAEAWFVVPIAPAGA
ncbi:hypothetical protein GGQ22_01150 [Nocardioides sp. zg-579]|uniref:Uncharacterized protein n=1 Tax=Nocardioides marmotae TaxID=2663857 RepID=A0A6I3J8V0_9ACTN|nr:hypothetical protein [Nocardioides marmotae]MCR6030049.1 hypothetical protein [Gordonia jinghuaiqii]MTB93680.1 hypothetical protein [Nocardioides marmotae]QKE00027.1 hypothetical protein HPC71_02220 [Nocardioides marmotae]